MFLCFPLDAEEEGELDPAKELIQPIAEKIMAKYKAKEEETPLLFFVAGEDDMTDSLRDYTNLPEAAPLLTILDMSARAKYVKDVEEITPSVVEQFVSDFLDEKLKPEPIWSGVKSWTAALNFPHPATWTSVWPSTSRRALFLFLSDCSIRSHFVLTFYSFKYVPPITKRPPPPVVPCIYYSADSVMQIFIMLIVFSLRD